MDPGCAFCFRGRRSPAAAFCSRRWPAQPAWRSRVDELRRWRPKAPSGASPTAASAGGLSRKPWRRRSPRRPSRPRSSRFRSRRATPASLRRSASDRANTISSNSTTASWRRSPTSSTPLDAYLQKDAAYKAEYESSVSANVRGLTSSTALGWARARPTASPTTPTRSSASTAPTSSRRPASAPPAT